MGAFIPDKSSFLRKNTPEQGFQVNPVLRRTRKELVLNQSYSTCRIMQAFFFDQTLLNQTTAAYNVCRPTHAVPLNEVGDES